MSNPVFAKIFVLGSFRWHDDGGEEPSLSRLEEVETTMRNATYGSATDRPVFEVVSDDRERPIQAKAMAHHGTPWESHLRKISEDFPEFLFAVQMEWEWAGYAYVLKSGKAVAETKGVPARPAGSPVR